ncbi:uncharacterized protein LOC127850812 isoform X2 [Dreissena polymorpha]|uniref:uncharacterized protein LOC127850812 isoform X2 n=1 Tax=Dreissena polymorpha TaxID=45954 RepID=UPI00226430AA|nr:uncharacterized protein LOC127850812 isoform X2 [Dreissena polymorpha]
MSGMDLRRMEPRLVKDISKEISTEFTMLRIYLDFTEAQFARLKHAYHNMDDQIFVMLNAWHDVVVRCGENPRHLLAAALDDCENRFLAVTKLVTPKELDELTPREREPREETKKLIKEINFTVPGDMAGTRPIFNVGAPNAVNVFPEMLQSMMVHYYDKTLSYVPTSALNNWVQAKVVDIYMPPNLSLMVKDKDSGIFKKTAKSIQQYSNMFLNNGKYNRNIFIQGESGSGKSTFLAKLVMDWIQTTKSVKRIETDYSNTADSDTRVISANFFKDLTTLKEYTFVFHVTLRDSVNEFMILQMIKEQIIDQIWSDKKERKNMYKLLNGIMKRERCLILLDGLDEWTGNAGHILPALAVSHSQCDVLITTRPWKVTETEIPNQKISSLLQLEGVNEPFEISRRLLGCRDDCKDSKDLDKKQSEFKSYILKNDLRKFLISPMLLQLILQSWVEGTEMKGSTCEVYSLFLESLIKKANEQRRTFQKPSFRCFKRTQYIQPNIENVDRLAEAAFHLLFSNTRDCSLVFSDTDLERFGLDEGERKEFAFKSGILSAARKSSSLGSSFSFSFIHKSVQEFLAAYYIACNTHLIDAIISGYLNRYKDAFMDISQVFIFLCGLEISAANKLSSMMNECDLYWRTDKFPNIILSGYREAVANKNSDIILQLSNFHFRLPVTEISDLYNIWIKNTSNILSLYLFIDEGESQSSPERGECASHYEFDMSSCSKLKKLTLWGKNICLKDSSCSSISGHVVWIVLNSADPLPAIPCIERIDLIKVTISSRVLSSLLSSLLTLDHAVHCKLACCSITSNVQGSDTAVSMTVLNKTLEIGFGKDSPGLWDALHRLNIKSLSLDGGFLTVLLMKHGELLSQSLSSLTQLETLTIHLRAYIAIQPPQSLKNLNIYCTTLLPSKLRELMDTLRACTQTIESRLEFGCAMLTNADDNHHEERIHQIAPEEYIPIVQELQTLKNVSVNRFRILDRIRENKRRVQEFCWSAHSNGDIDDDKQNGDNFKDDLYTVFVRCLDDEIIHRISMRLLITPASTSRVSNQYGCNT